MISDIEEFIRYFHGQRRRTQWLVDVLPAEKAGWRPWPGEPSPAEIICRIAAGHWMYATATASDRWEIDRYEEQADTWESALHYFHFRTEAALDVIRPLNNAVLKQKRRRPDGESTQAWRLLAAMLEHEITHRSQISSYLMLLNVRSPRLDAVSIESVRMALEKR